MKLVLAAALAVLAGPALAQSVALQGPDGQAATLSAADLAALPHVSVTANGQVIAIATTSSASTMSVSPVLIASSHWLAS